MWTLVAHVPPPSGSAVLTDTSHDQPQMLSSGSSSRSPVLPFAEIAGFGRRVSGLILDSGFIAVMFVGAAAILDHLLRLSGEDQYDLGFAIGVFAPFAFACLAGLMLPLALASAARVAGGRTPGKALVGTAIRQANSGEGLGFLQLLWREAVRGLLIALFFVPTLYDHFRGLANPSCQPAHDSAAGTIVIRARPRIRDLILSLVVLFAVLLAETAVVYGIFLG